MAPEIAHDKVGCTAKMMPPPENKLLPHDTPRLTDQKVLSYAQDLLEAHLPLGVTGYTCRSDDLFKVLLSEAAKTITYPAACTHSRLSCTAASGRPAMAREKVWASTRPSVVGREWECKFRGTGY